MIVRQALQLSGTRFSRTVLAGLLIAGIGGASATVGDVASRGAFFQVVATGFEKPTGLAVHPQGFLVLTDRETGVLYRLTPGYTAAGAPAFTSEILFSGLDEPIGVAVDGDGHLLVAESDKGRLVRFEKLGEQVFSAVLEAVETGLKEPRWLAVDGEGTVFLSAEGVKQEKLAKGTPRPKDDVLLRITPDGAISVVADGFKELSGLAIDPGGHLLAGATQWRGEKAKSDGRILKIRLSDGQVSRVVTGGVRGPQDLEYDVLGALFFTANEYREGKESDDDDNDDREETRSSSDGESEGRHEEDHEDLDDDEPGRPGKGVILKATFKPDGSLQRLTPFAGGLGKPAGVAFDKDGNLYVAERQHGRVLRFQAPDPPVLDQSLPRYTNQATLMVRGTAAPDTILTLLGGAAPVSGKTEADGTFILAVPLIPKTEQTLHVYATSRGGDGLTSAPKVLTVTHDDQPPDTDILDGPSGELSSTTATFTFTATEAGSTFLCQLDQGEFAPCTSPKSYTGLTQGPLHTFRVKAQDLAGNADATPAEHSFTVRALNVQITNPAAGTTVPAGSLLVRGTVGAGDAEVGVSVNSVPAAVQGSDFAALVPVAPDTTTLTAMAATGSGATASHSIPISVSAATENVVTLYASPPSGIPPLTVHFSLVNGLPVTAVELDADGNGSADFTGTRLDEQPFTFTLPGVYVATGRVTDTQGTQRTAQVIIQVFNRAVLDALLQKKWNAMKDALRVGQIAAAVANITERTRADYESAFNIIAAQLPNIGVILTDITMVEVRHAAAIYEATRVDGSLVKSFEVRFAIDGDGVWRIEVF